MSRATSHYFMRWLESEDYLLLSIVRHAPSTVSRVQMLGYIEIRTCTASCTTIQATVQTLKEHRVLCLCTRFLQAPSLFSAVIYQQPWKWSYPDRRVHYNYSTSHWYFLLFMFLCGIFPSQSHFLQLLWGAWARRFSDCQFFFIRNNLPSFAVTGSV